MKHNRWFTILALFIALSMMLASCAPAATPTAAPIEAAAPTEVPPTEAPAPTEPPAPTEAPAKNTIIIGVTDQIASLDPADAYAIHDWELIKNTGEGLLKWAPGTTDLELGLAAAMPEISEDGLVYTLKLRPDIKFADGLELTAPLLAQQLNRLLTIGPGETCPNAVASALATPYVESIEAPDDETIVFTLKQPVGFFSQILATAPYVVSHPDIFTSRVVQPLPRSTCLRCWTLVHQPVYAG